MALVQEKGGSGRREAGKALVASGRFSTFVSLPLLTVEEVDVAKEAYRA